MKTIIRLFRSPQGVVYHIRMLLVLLAVTGSSSGFGQSWVQLKDIGTTVTGSSSAPPPLEDALSLSANGKIYVLGCSKYPGAPATAKMWEYNPNGDSWTEKSPYPGKGFIGFCGFTIGNSLYVGCGLDSLIFDVSDFYKYNTITNSWTPIANIPVPRMFASGFAIGSKGYVTGGETVPMGTYLDDHWEYDTTSNNWIQKASFPDTSRALSTSFSAGGFGFVGLGVASNKPFNDFYKYNPATDSWSEISSLPGQGRWGAGSIVRGNYGIIICGTNSMNYLNDCYSYNTVLDTWSNFKSLSGVGRSYAICGIAGDQLYAGGGSGGITVLKDWWSIQLTVGVNSNYLEKGQMTIFQNAWDESILRSNTELTIGKPYRVFDIQGRLVDNGVIAGKETKLQVDIPGIYTVVIGSDRLSALKFRKD